MHPKRILGSVFALLTAMVVAWLVGCSQHSTQVAEVAEAGAPIAFRREADDSIVSDDTRSLRLRLTSRGALFQRKGLSGQLTTMSIGRGTAPVLGSGVTSIAGARAELARDGVVESYELRTNGIEQIFRVAERPTGSGPLVVRIAVDGLVVDQSRSTGALDLKKPSDDGTALRYGEVSATDANGQSVDCRLAKEGETIRIEVEDASAVYPVVIDPLVWGLRTKLVWLEARSGDLFGGSVAIGQDEVAVGAGQENGTYGGFVVFRKQAGEWQLEGHIQAPYEGAWQFGSTLALDGDDAFVASVGPGFVYHRGLDSWQLTQGLPTDQVSFAAVPAPIAHTDGLTALLNFTPPAPDGGSQNSTVVTYGLDAGAWTPTSELLVPEQVALGNGGALAIDAQHVVVGTGVAVSVFVKNDDHYELENHLTDGDGISFGQSVAISGSTIIAGSLYERAAYIFVETAQGWIRQQKVVSISPAEGYFGTAVAIVGDTAWVGDPFYGSAGVVYRYLRTNGVWSLEEQIHASTTTGAFGAAIAATSTAVVIGAPGEMNMRGAAYLYELGSSTGSNCESDDACAGGYCVDGVCCESVCDRDEPERCATCRGAVPGACAPAAAGTLCRLSSSSCDPAEVCDGKQMNCPRDGILANNSLCAGGLCMAGACVADGADAAAPSLATVDLTAGGGCSAAPLPPRSCTFSVVVFGLCILAVSRRRRGVAALLCVGIVVGVACPGSSDQLTLTSHAISARLLSADESIITDLSTGRSTTMSLVGVAREGGPERAPRFLEAREAGVRIERRSPEIIEWFAAAERGIEHGFDLPTRPDGANALVLRLRVVSEGGLSSGANVAVLDQHDPTFVYGNLVATDARGRRQPSHLSVQREFIELVVDDRNAEYPLIVDPLVWRQRQVLEPPAGALPYSPTRFFGASIALDADRLVVGRPTYDDPGAAYVFLRQGNDWTLESTLVPPIGGEPSFGSSVAISGSEVIVGAPPPSGLGTSNVYAFTRSGVAWTYEGPIVSPSPSLSQGFGTSLALDGDQLFVGAHNEGQNADGSPGPGWGTDNQPPGAIYQYHHLATGWQYQSKLSAVGQSAHNFGASLSLKGSVLLVGACCGYASNAAFQGQVFDSAWFYRMDQGGALSVERVETAPPETNQYAAVVATDGTTAAVATPLASVYLGQPVSTGGSVQIYSRATGSWVEDQRIVSPDESGQDGFGLGLTVSDQRVLVTAPGAAGSMGESYLFERSTPGWTVVDSSRIVGTGTDQRFGYAVALGRDVFMIGTRGAETVRVVYFGDEGDPCTSGENCASGQCIDGVCCSSSCGGGDPNDCQACSVAAGAAVDGTCGPVQPRTCRAAREACDVAELCDGKSLECPDDEVATNGSECEGGICSAGMCLADLPRPPVQSPFPPSTGDSGCSIGEHDAAPVAPNSWLLVTIALVAGLRVRRKS